MNAHVVFHKLRVIASFALLGAVTFGMLSHGINTSFDLSAVGAVLGAGAASAKVLNIV